MVHSSCASTGEVVLVDIVAVEAEACLEPERVAGAEAGRRHLLGRQQGAGELDRVLAGDRDLEAVLAGIAEPGDPAGEPAQASSRSCS